MILLKRQYTIGGQSLIVDQPADPNQLPGFTFADVFKQGPGAPITAVNHIIDHNTVTDQGYYAPNLKLVLGSEIVFQPDNTSGVSSYVSNSLTNVPANFNYDIGMADQNLLYFFQWDGYWPTYPYAEGDYIGFYLTEAGVNYIQYSGGVRQILYTKAGSGDLYFQMQLYHGNRTKYLQYKGAIPVDNSGNPI